MSTWKEFYLKIKAKSWPNCDDENNFDKLPDEIKKECIEVFGYQPGSFQRKSKLIHKVFPIQTKTACQLKWTWSTIFLTDGTTASCHRTNHHEFDTENFNFHNTPEKLADRKKMLEGKWPDKGCGYCKNIENAGGISDRITNLDLPGIHAPPELENNPFEINVTPRILEVYFDNLCNLKCVYCSSKFSSLWDAENIKYEGRAFIKNTNFEKNKQKVFDYLKIHNKDLVLFNFLGGEPLYQQEFIDCLELFEKYPAPNLKLQIFSNLNIKLSKLKLIVNKIEKLIETNKLREFEITASLDCWGKEAEYVRFPLNLIDWEKNFNYLLSKHWINLIIGSVITPLTIKTLPDLLEKINEWSKVRKVYHYQNSVTFPDHQYIDIFGDIFNTDFNKAIELKKSITPEDISSKKYLEGIATQCRSSKPNPGRIKLLFDFLNENDRRRNTNWPSIFPWLVDEFAKYNLYAQT